MISNRFVATMLSELQNGVMIPCVCFDLWTNMCCICFTALQPHWMGSWNFALFRIMTITDVLMPVLFLSTLSKEVNLIVVLIWLSLEEPFPLLMERIWPFWFASYSFSIDRMRIQSVWWVLLHTLICSTCTSCTFKVVFHFKMHFSLHSAVFHLVTIT